MLSSLFESVIVAEFLATEAKFSIRRLFVVEKGILSLRTHLINFIVREKGHHYEENEVYIQYLCPDL
jgi:hypothetical protein